MEIFGRRLPSFETVSRVFENLILPEARKKPLAMAFYLTFACNAACDFCSQGDLVYGDERRKYDPDLQTQLDVLKLMREDVPNIYLMGGEPTVSPNFAAILSECQALGFDVVGVNTNAMRFRPEILEDANLLVISLFSTDRQKLAASFQRDEITGQRVLSNVRRYAEERDARRLQIVINKVVTGGPGDITEAYRVANFCSDLGVSFNLAPAVMAGGRPDSRLVGNVDYQQLIDDCLLDMRLMACSARYLETIREFDDFDCLPHVIPGVHPNGDLIVPCATVENPAMVNLLEAGGVAKALRRGRQQFGDFDPSTECADLCHKTCYVEAANLDSASFVLDFFRRMFRKRLRFVEEAPEEVQDEVVQRIDEFLSGYLDDLHGFAYINQNWLAKHEDFSRELLKFKEDELLIIKRHLEMLAELFEDRWDYAFADYQKGLAVFADIANTVVMRPFERLLRRVEGLLKVQLLSDLSGSHAINRLRDYIKRVDIKLINHEEVA